MPLDRTDQLGAQSYWIKLWCSRCNRWGDIRPETLAGFDPPRDVAELKFRCEGCL